MSRIFEVRSIVMCVDTSGWFELPTVPTVMCWINPGYTGCHAILYVPNGTKSIPMSVKEFQSRLEKTAKAVDKIRNGGKSDDDSEAETPNKNRDKRRARKQRNRNKSPKASSPSRRYGGEREDAEETDILPPRIPQIKRLSGSDKQKAKKWRILSSDVEYVPISKEMKKCYVPETVVATPGITMNIRHRVEDILSKPPSLNCDPQSYAMLAILFSNVITGAPMLISEFDTMIDLIKSITPVWRARFEMATTNMLLVVPIKKVKSAPKKLQKSSPAFTREEKDMVIAMKTVKVPLTARNVIPEAEVVSSHAILPVTINKLDKPSSATLHSIPGTLNPSMKTHVPGAVSMFQTLGAGVTPEDLIPAYNKAASHPFIRAGNDKMKATVINSDSDRIRNLLYKEKSSASIVDLGSKIEPFLKNAHHIVTRAEYNDDLQTIFSTIAPDADARLRNDAKMLLCAKDQAISVNPVYEPESKLKHSASLSQRHTASISAIMNKLEYESIRYDVPCAGIRMKEIKHQVVDVRGANHAVASCLLQAAMAWGQRQGRYELHENDNRLRRLIDLSNLDLLKLTTSTFAQLARGANLDEFAMKTFVEGLTSDLAYTERDRLIALGLLHHLVIELSKDAFLPASRLRAFTENPLWSYDQLSQAIGVEAPSRDSKASILSALSCVSDLPTPYQTASTLEDLTMNSLKAALKQAGWSNHQLKKSSNILRDALQHEKDERKYGLMNFEFDMNDLPPGIYQEVDYIPANVPLQDVELILPPVDEPVYLPDVTERQEQTPVWSRATSSHRSIAPSVRTIEEQMARAVREHAQTEPNRSEIQNASAVLSERSIGVPEERNTHVARCALRENHDDSRDSADEIAEDYMQELIDAAGNDDSSDAESDSRRANPTDAESQDSDSNDTDSWASLTEGQFALRLIEVERRLHGAVAGRIAAAIDGRAVFRLVREHPEDPEQRLRRFPVRDQRAENQDPEHRYRHVQEHDDDVDSLLPEDWEDEVLVRQNLREDQGRVAMIYRRIVERVQAFNNGQDAPHRPQGVDNAAAVILADAIVDANRNPVPYRPEGVPWARAPIPMVGPVAEFNNVNIPPAEEVGERVGEIHPDGRHVVYPNPPPIDQRAAYEVEGDDEPRFNRITDPLAYRIREWAQKLGSLIGSTYSSADLTRATSCSIASRLDWYITNSKSDLEFSRVIDVSEVGRVQPLMSKHLTERNSAWRRAHATARQLIEARKQREGITPLMQIDTNMRLCTLDQIRRIYPNIDQYRQIEMDDDWDPLYSNSCRKGTPTMHVDLFYRVRNIAAVEMELRNYFQTMDIMTYVSDNPGSTMHRCSLGEQGMEIHLGEFEVFEEKRQESIGYHCAQLSFKYNAAKARILDELIASLTRVFSLTAIRPLDQVDYDRTYWATNNPWKLCHEHRDHHEVQKPSLERPYVTLTTIRARKIESVNPYGKDFEETWWMNDVHYYFNHDSFLNYPSTMCCLSGMNYTFYQAGFYSYPFGSGEYCITALDHPEDPELGFPFIRVSTKGTGANGDYSHPVVLVANPTLTWDLPWFSFVSHLGPLTGLILTVPVIPNAPIGNAQFDYFSQRATFSNLFVVSKPTAASDQYAASAIKTCERLLQVTDVSLIVARTKAIAGVLRNATPDKLSFEIKRKFGLRTLAKLWHAVTLSSDTHVVTTRNEVIAAHQQPRDLDFGGWLTIKYRHSTVRTASDLDMQTRSVLTFGMKSRKMKAAEAYTHLNIAREAGSKVFLNPSTELEKAFSHEFLAQTIINKKLVGLKPCKPFNPDTIEAENQPSTPYYYVVKPVDKSQLRLNSTTMKSSINYDMLERVRKLDYKTAPILRVEERWDVGYKADSPTGPLINFEMDSKSTINFLSAFYARHLAPLTKPDPCVVERFDKWSAQWISNTAQKIYDLGDVADEDIIDFPDYYAQKGFPEAKKSAYIQECVRQLNTADYGSLAIYYSLMVKSGEVYTSPNATFDDGFILGVSERPRLIWNPSASGKGLINYLQGFVFPRLRQVCPEFVHGANSTVLKSMITSKVSRFTDPVSISLDGSAFDSTQFAELQDCVDRRFLHALLPYFEEILTKLVNKHHHHSTPNVKELAYQLVEAALCNKAQGFAVLPELANTGWCLPPKFRAAARKALGANIGNASHEHSPYEVFVAEVTGTTFSGNPVKTTLGNTLRSICYYKFLLKDFKNELMAAGDDVVIWVERADAPAAMHQIRMNTASNANAQTVGLGQIVKDIAMREWWDLDFCSKMFFYTKKSGFTMLRDIRKTLTTKLSHDPKCGLAPHEFATAVTQAAMRELPCPWLHQLMIKRLLDTPCPNDEEKFCLGWNKYAQYYKFVYFLDLADGKYEQMCNDEELQLQLLTRSKMNLASYYSYATGKTNRIVFGKRCLVDSSINHMKQSSAKKVTINLSQAPAKPALKGASTRKQSVTRATSRSSSKLRTPREASQARRKSKNHEKTAKRPDLIMLEKKAEKKTRKGGNNQPVVGHHMRPSGVDSYTVSNWASNVDMEMYKQSTISPGVVPALPVFDGHTPACAPYVAGCNYIPVNNSIFTQEWQLFFFAPVLGSSTPASSGSGIRVLDIPNINVNLSSSEVFNSLPFGTVWNSTPTVWSDGLRCTSARLTVKPEVAAAQACGTVYWNTCSWKQLQAGITMQSVLAGGVSAPYQAGHHYSVTVACSNTAFLLNGTATDAGAFELAEDERIGFIAFHNVSRPLNVTTAVGQWTWTASVAMNYIVFPFYDDTLLQHMTDDPEDKGNKSSMSPASGAKNSGAVESVKATVVEGLKRGGAVVAEEALKIGIQKAFGDRLGPKVEAAILARREANSKKLALVPPRVPEIDIGMSNKPIPPLNPGKNGFDLLAYEAKHSKQLVGDPIAMVHNMNDSKWVAMGIAANALAFGGMFPGKVFGKLDVDPAFYPAPLNAASIFITRSLEDQASYYMPETVRQQFDNVGAAFASYLDALQTAAQNQEKDAQDALIKLREQAEHDAQVDRRCKDLLYEKLLDEQRGKIVTLRPHPTDEFYVVRSGS